MNRELKFRCWDSQIMRTDFSLRADGVADDELEYVDDFGNVTKGIVMQFTGLHDKNDVEIYEGDRYQVMGNLIYEVRWLDGTYQHEYYGGCFGLWANDELFFPFDENALKNGVVVGNIYIPEVLENK